MRELGLILAGVALACVSVGAPVGAYLATVALAGRRTRRRPEVEVGLAGLGLVDDDELAEHPVSFGPVDQPDAEECALTLDERREFAALRHEIEAALADVGP